MKKLLIATALTTLSSLVHAEICPKPWACDMLESNKKQIVWSPLPTEKKIKFRAGYLKEQGRVFKGNIIYFQGLGDSMLNHMPLFNKLTAQGFRVIAFDYLGQGKSEGKMNQTRIDEIPELGEIAWNRFALGKTSYENKTVIGWSTGGLAAYHEANAKKAKRVVLIAPGISPNKIVGENDLSEGKINRITLPTLTTERYLDVKDPHIDPIKPNSPMKAPAFATNLLATAAKSHHWKINSTIQGMVLLSGQDDTYVNAEETKALVKKNASHFEIVTYEGALHEIDNEVKSISEQAHQDILNFLE